MTESQLLNYKMNNDELQKWNSLCEDVKNVIHNAYIPDVSPFLIEDFLDRKTMVREPFYGARGYTDTDGFYSVQEGDRGVIYVKFHMLSSEEAKVMMLKELAHDISYAYITSDMEDLQRKYQSKWHFYEMREGIKDGRMISHLEENRTWIYDAEYDYRKYWFELLLFIDKQVLPENEYFQEINVYQNYMNYHMADKKWCFDFSSCQFELK